MNIDLADRVLKQIKTHPETWDQQLWIGTRECGTVGCFAGWTCILGDPTARKEPHSNSWVTIATDDPVGMARRFPSCMALDRGFIRVSVPDYAAYLLGLGEAAAYYLFSGARTLDDIEAFVDLQRQCQTARLVRETFVSALQPTGEDLRSGDE